MLWAPLYIIYMEKRGQMFTDIVINHACIKLLSCAPELYAIVHTGRKQGTHGAARVDDHLDQCFCLLLELLSFGWIGL